MNRINRLPTSYLTALLANYPAFSCAFALSSTESATFASGPHPPVSFNMSLAQQRGYSATHSSSKYGAPSVTPTSRRHGSEQRHRSGAGGHNMRTLSVTLPRDVSANFDFSVPSHMATPPASPPRHSSGRKIELPLALPDPAFPPVDPAGIESLDPELRGVPVEYVAHKLRSIGPELLNGLGFVTPPQTAYTASNMPAWVDVRVSSRLPSIESLPSHVLCVVNPQSKQPGQLIPVHALIYATQCSNFPRLTRATPHVDAASKCARLAVVPLYLPSPQTFNLLNSYLYTKRAERLLSTLAPISSSALASIPVGHQGASNTLSALGRAMAEAFPLPNLVEHAVVVHGLWSNVVTLGIDDEVLWWALETAWGIITTAIALASGQQI
ncbi:unnamed protein product [Rhizoctonia solani]|uniref:Clp1-like protein n=1 Tax=Rhizoctonia solani TaxID=456999 RepID=A0A8H2W7T3_9AGAM